MPYAMIPQPGMTTSSGLGQSYIGVDPNQVQQSASQTYNTDAISQLLAAFGGQNEAYSKYKSQGQQQILGGYDQLLQSLLGQANQLGAAQGQAIKNNQRDTTNTALARLQDRGLGGSTFALTAAQGGQRIATQQNNELQENLLGQKMGIQNTIGQAKLGTQKDFLQQNAPDQNLLIQLLNGIGRIQNGGGAAAGTASKQVFRSY